MPIDAHHQIACESCDALIRLPTLKRGESARCARCGYTVAKFHPQGAHRAHALSLAALLLLAVALVSPLFSMVTAGQVQTLTLLESGTALMDARQPVLGTLVIAAVVAFPALTMGLILLMVMAQRLTIDRPMWVLSAKILHEVRHWNMVEVYIIGVVVSLAKLSGQATIELGISFYALVGFGLCFLAAIRNFDHVDMWSLIGARSQ